MPEKTPTRGIDVVAMHVGGFLPDFKRHELVAAIDDALRAARDAALEEAAQIAEATQYRSQGPITEYIAAAIRKLKETQP